MKNKPNEKASALTLHYLSLLRFLFQVLQSHRCLGVKSSLDVFKVVVVPLVFCLLPLLGQDFAGCWDGSVH